MAPTAAEIADFERYARNPETWLIGSRRHLAVFDILTERANQLSLRSNQSQDEFSGCRYGAYLHAGLAVENAMKACMIRRDPSILKNGRVDKRRFGGKSGHILVEPCTALLGPITELEKRTIFKLEEHVIWAGKYTVPITPDVLLSRDALQTLRTVPMDEPSIVHSIVKRLQELASAP